MSHGPGKEFTSPVTPALMALGSLRAELKKRVGKEGGNLNKEIYQYLNTVEATLLQIEPLGNMLKLINQQTEVAVHTMRALSHVTQQALPENGTNGDDGTSETHGA